MQDPLIALADVARQVEPMLDRLVFVGGTVAPLLITDPAASSNVRPTDDVDTIIEVATRAAYDALEEKLRALKLRNDTSQGAPICRWRTPRGTKLDVMPLGKTFLGFSNRWYRLAIETSVALTLSNGLVIRHVAAPAFVATKLEAFLSRGRGDYLASHDLEDLIAVIDGRAEIESELAALPSEAQRFIASKLRELLNDEDFVSALEGHIEPGPASSERALLLESRLRQIAGR